MYRATVWELLHLAVCRLPDISLTVKDLYRKAYKPTVRRDSQLKRFLDMLPGREVWESN